MTLKQDLKDMAEKVRQLMGSHHADLIDEVAAAAPQVEEVLPDPVVQISQAEAELAAPIPESPEVVEAAPESIQPDETGPVSITPMEVSPTPETGAEPQAIEGIAEPEA